MLFFSSSIVACIDAPTYVLDESSTSTSETTPVSGEGDDTMVLVPATTFPTQGTLAPNAPGGAGGDDGEEKGKGKGPDGGGGGTDPVPAPTASTTSVPAFWIDVHEVSARAYAACVAGRECTAPRGDRDCTVASGLGDHPANCVALDQARAFCASRGKRLVKNDEWTAAAAGAQLRPYPWGADAPSPTRVSMAGEDDGWKATAPRGTFPAGRSPEGVFDLAGNVAEWVDVSGTNIVRGGSYADNDVASVSSLSVQSASGPDAKIGFRCAKDR